MGNSKTKPEQGPKTTESTNSPDSIYPQLQIRNCVRDVRNHNSNFSDMYPNEIGASCGRSSNPENFTNPGYVATEDASKRPQPNDGLPTYEEAIGVAIPVTPTAPPPPPQPQTTIEVINEDEADATSSRRRHRHRHRRHRNHNSGGTDDSHPETDEQRRHRPRRGFRLKRHLAKMKRRQAETE